MNEGSHVVAATEAEVPDCVVLVVSDAATGQIFLREQLLQHSCTLFLDVFHRHHFADAIRRVCKVRSTSPMDRDAVGAAQGVREAHRKHLGGKHGWDNFVGVQSIGGQRHQKDRVGIQDHVKFAWPRTSVGNVAFETKPEPRQHRYSAVLQVEDIVRTRVVLVWRGMFGRHVGR